MSPARQGRGALFALTKATTNAGYPSAVTK